MKRQTARVSGKVWIGITGTAIIIAAVVFGVMEISGPRATITALAGSFVISLIGWGIISMAYESRHKP